MTGRTAEAPPRLAARYSATRCSTSTTLTRTLPGPRNGRQAAYPGWVMMSGAGAGWIEERPVCSWHCTDPSADELQRAFAVAPHDRFGGVHRNCPADERLLDGSLAS